MRFYTNIQMVGNQILVRGYENGQRYTHRDVYNPTLFVSSKKKSKYRTLSGEYVEPVKPGTIRETRDFITKYNDVDGFDVFGFERFIYQYISDNYPEDQIEFDISKIKLVTIDIETKSENGFPDVESASEEVLLITIQDYTTKEIITWGTRPFNNIHDNVDYCQCNDEHHLLSSFIQWWIENTPDVVTGWNCEFFDIPYIAGRLNRVLGAKLMKRLSPWGLVTQNEVVKMGRKNFVVDIGGVSVLDYMRLYKWSPGTPNQESFRLDYIAQQELGQQKLDHSEFDTFKDFYTNGWQKFVEYNIIDVQLVDRLEDKLKLIELALTMAYDAKVNYQDIFFQVRLWDCIIYNELKKRGIAIPPKIGSKKDEKYAGAYVKEPIPGKYDWVVSFDLNSLYPHLIMQYNISPETLRPTRHPSASVERILKREIDVDSNYATCANGAQYRKDIRGFLPELMQKYYDQRVTFKRRMIDAKKKYEKAPSKALEKEIARCNNIQMAKKISLNSAYGAIGNQYFRYYKLENAEAITLSGQVSIRWIENKMNQKINKILKTEEVDYVIASDTDSIYLNMGPFVDAIFKGREATNVEIVDFLDKVCEVEFEKYISNSYQALADYVNAYDQKMFMKRENIADRGIWTAKKRYILNVWDSEGVRYADPKLKIMGLEAVKSSTPAPCRQMIKDGLKVIMSGTEDEMIDYIDNCRKEFKSLPPEEISFPRSVSNVTKYKGTHNIYEKGTPMHVRGALLFNHYVKERKLDKKYAYIQNGEKIKFCYLKDPNPTRENVISFIQDFPKELDLARFVDYDTQFNKAFLEPVKAILNAIGWSDERKITLESFFT